MEFSCLHDWLLLANAINYYRLLLLIALCNLTNPTDQEHTDHSTIKIVHDT